MHYLGPLRSPAQRYYVAPAEASEGLDPTGAFLPYVLRDQRTQRVPSVLPGSTRPAKEAGQVPLANALGSWLRYLRTGDSTWDSEADELAVATTKNVLVEVKIPTAAGTGSYALADSGFGYSQVLPILVRGLLARRGSTLLVEQPELHLNPALQVRLAEFFVAMARAGKQCVIETHSEHIVNAIRVAVAEDELGDLAPMCRVFYLDTGQGPPQVHELSIQPDGTMAEWPPSFFGEAMSLTSRLLRAQRRFRSRPAGAV
jgi:predicted ATPase